MLKPLSTFLILRGILAVALGIMALVWPGVTVFTLGAVALALLFGMFSLTNGAGLIIQGIGPRQNRNARPSVVPQRKAA